MWIFLDHYRNRNNCLIYLISINNKESPIWQFRVGFSSLRIVEDPRTQHIVSQSMLLLLRRMSSQSKSDHNVNRQPKPVSTEKSSVCEMQFNSSQGKVGILDDIVRAVKSSNVTRLLTWWFLILSHSRKYTVDWNFCQIFVTKNNSNEKNHKFFLADRRSIVFRCFCCSRLSCCVNNLVLQVQFG